MRRAIELAKKGRGFVNPNPLVGAVIVKDGRIIGEGYHTRYGELHAEREALKSLRESAEGADIYVTLEPCCHHGKQPPCTEAIVESGIRRVFVGSPDPNPLVRGKGLKFLREHGIEVFTDVLREECDALNPVFFKYITRKIPYVIYKYAMTLDGKTACYTGDAKWVSNDLSRDFTQDMRGECMSIMAGIGTVLADDPMLNARKEGLRQPVRLICDSGLRISAESKLVQSAGDYPLWILASENLSEEGKRKKAQLEASGAEVILLPEEGYASGMSGEESRGAEPPEGSQKEYGAGAPADVINVRTGRLSLTAALRVLGERGIDSILLEGGGTLAWSFMEQNLIDEIRVFIAPKLFGGENAASPVRGEGIDKAALAPAFHPVESRWLGEDLYVRYVKDVYRDH